MKKVFISILAAILILSLAGCGIKQKIENKVGEAVGEKVLEGVTDGKVNVDGDKVTVKGEDGTEVTFGGTEWPKSELLKDVPKFDNGKIISVSESEEIVMILIEEVEKKDFESYCEKIKNNFTEETMSAEMDGTISYGGADGKGVYIQLVYSTSDSSFGITATKDQE